MTDRMRDDLLDGEIRTFLAWQADDIADAPTATEMAIRIGDRARSGTRGLRLTPQIVWVALAGLLILALIGVAAGALSQRQPIQPPSSRAYEAVFLRTEVVDGAQQVVVVGVNAKGHQRQIATLPDAWVNEASVGSLGWNLPPMGAVSPSGLLAIPSGGSDLMMHWDIFDVHRSEAEPVAVAGIESFIEQLRDTPYWIVNGRGGVFWGPGERLAILWYPCCGGAVDLHLTFVEGRTGAATSVDIPEGRTVLPAWASDGSGVFVGSGPADVEPRRVLRRDGAVTDAPAALAQGSCRMPSGFALACLAPDDSMIADIGGGTTASGRGARLITQGNGASFDVNGSFAGWLEVDR